MVSFSSMSFRSERAAGFRRPGGIRRGCPRSLFPPVRVIERRSPKVHSQSRDFAHSEQSLMSRSAFDGPSGQRLEADPEDDGAGTERSRFRLTTGCARESLAQEGQGSLDLVPGKLFGRAVGDHAAPAAAAVRVVFVELDADARVLAEHCDLAA